MPTCNTMQVVSMQVSHFETAFCALLMVEVRRISDLVWPRNWSLFMCLASESDSIITCGLTFFRLGSWARWLGVVNKPSDSSDELLVPASGDPDPGVSFTFGARFLWEVDGLTVPCDPSRGSLSCSKVFMAFTSSFKSLFSEVRLFI